MDELKCNCGKVYKREKAFITHINSCEYVDLDSEKVLQFGYMINNINKSFFAPHYGKIRKNAKDNGLTIEQSKKILVELEILKYRKMLWDSYNILSLKITPSEYRDFIRWVFNTYNDISLISFKKLFTNEKVYYRFLNELSFKFINRRIDESLLYTHEYYKNKMITDFEFVEDILLGNISIYFVLFNDYLSTEWFGQLETQLQNDLTHYINIASKQILQNITSGEFDKLLQKGNTFNPKLFSFE